METTAPDSESPSHDAEWDAGDMGCGELVMHLSNRLRAIPGKVLKVTATDSGARADLPAFCRMTGHELVQATPGAYTYWIRARTQAPR